MKILQVSPYADPKVGGQERHVLELSKTLASLGHKVTLLTCQLDSSKSPQKFQVCKINSLDILDLRFLLSNELFSFLVENRFDVCHLHHQTLFGETVLLANKMCGLPTITTLHTQIVRRVPAKFFYDRLSLEFIGRISNRVICLSSGIKQNLVKRGLSPSKCVVIPNAIDVKSLKDRFQRIQKNLQEPEFDLLFVGRLEKRKGIEWLLRSLDLLHKEEKVVTLKIVGHGPLKDDLQRFVSTNDLEEHVRFLGYVSDTRLLELFLLTKCIVVPSFYEGVPGVAIEAMTAGKPLIVSNIPGLAELIVNGGNGFIVNPMDTQGLISAIDKILASHNFKSLNELNEKLLASFDWEVVASKILDTYHEALMCRGN
jgi:phosphatidylinositol alpha-mannosyltransferase